MAHFLRLTGYENLDPRDLHAQIVQLQYGPTSDEVLTTIGPVNPWSPMTVM